MISADFEMMQALSFPEDILDFAKNSANSKNAKKETTSQLPSMMMN